MKTVKEKTSPYHTDKAVRTKIDNLLKQNSTIWCNLGTGSSLDSKTRKEGEKRWRVLSKEIKALDEEFYNIVCPYGIDS